MTHFEVWVDLVLIRSILSFFQREDRQAGSPAVLREKERRLQLSTEEGNTTQGCLIYSHE